MRISACIKRGKGKKKCEDWAGVNFNLLNEGYFSMMIDMPVVISVADGVGGNAGGYDASKFAVNSAAETGSRMLKYSMEKINNKLLEYAASSDGKEKMATTFSAICFEPLPYILHIGNTRIYAMQGEYIKRLTIDHSTAEFLERIGNFEGTECVPKNEIYACMGGGNSQLFSHCQLIETDRFFSRYILTSDGVHDYVSDDVLENFANCCDYSENAFYKLFDIAERNDSDDDKTMLVIECETT